MFENLAQIINAHRKFVITSHVNPDGDAIGSELALLNYLKNLGKNAIIINHSATPDNYKFLDTSNEIEQYSEDKHKQVFLDSDVIFIIDTNEYSRIRAVADAVKESQALKICIDHHLGFSKNGYDYSYIDTESPATGEILFRFFESQGVDTIKTEVAVPLYAAIMTDTGSFRFPRTDSETHRIAGRLIDLGADPDKIYSGIFNSATYGKLKLLSIFLNRLNLRYDGRIGYSVLYKNDFADTETGVMDTENFSHHIMSLATVQIGIIFIESERGLKISFRSKGNIFVNELAKKFNGGGHQNAAGAFIENADTEKTVIAVLDETKKYFNN